MKGETSFEMKEQFVQKIAKVIGALSLIKYPLMLVGVFFASLFIAGSFFVSDVNSVVISDGDSLYELTTSSENVQAALYEAGIEYSEDCHMNCNLGDSLANVEYIEVTKPTKVTFSVGGQKKTVAAHSQSVPELIEQNGLDVGAFDEISVSETPEESIEVTVIKVQELFEKEYEIIEFETEYVEDSDMYAGETEVRQKGSNGKKVYTFKTRLENSVLVSRECISQAVETEPVNEIVAYGTKATMETSRGKVVYSDTLDVVATAYTNDAKWGDSTASGMRTRWGIIAVDPDVIAMGTKVYVQSLDGSADYGFAIAADTGAHIVDHKIDLWMDSEDLCDVWGVRNVRVYILDNQDADIFDLRAGSTWSY